MVQVFIEAGAKLGATNDVRSAVCVVLVGYFCVCSEALVLGVRAGCSLAVCRGWAGCGGGTRKVAKTMRDKLLS